jgi:tetratricopeptide (TPR) repeat protein
MLSNKPLDQFKEIPEIYRQRIVELNQESFDQLLTFVDIVPDDAFDLGFIQSNFARDRDAIIQALICHPDSQEMQFEIWDFPDPEMRFLLDEILKVLPTVKVQADKKLIFIVRGVENAIGMTGEYPPMLVDFNWVRDAYPVKVPHTMIFCLPDYAITRVANFAPDFWAWNSGTFVFKTPVNTRDDAISKTLDASKGISNCELPEKQEPIDLLKRLLIEYTPSNGSEQTQGDLKTRIRVLNDLGIAYRSRSEYKTAKYYLEQALSLAKNDEDLGDVKANGLHELAIVERNLGEIEKAITLEQQAMEIFEHIGDIKMKAATLHELAGIYANQGDVEKAIAFYQQSLELKEKIGNVQGKAATLHQLAGIYEDQGDVEKAIAFYQQSLEVTEKIGDVQGKAATLHQLAGIYEDQGDVEKAIAFYQQSLELKEKIGDVQGKAATLHQLAGIYEDQGDVEKAIAFYQESLEVTEKIGNVQGKAATFAMLGQLLADEKGDFDQALNYLQQSLEILQHLRSPSAETVKEIMARVESVQNG